jgi:hypothetical protein
VHRASVCSDLAIGQAEAVNSADMYAREAKRTPSARRRTEEKKTNKKTGVSEMTGLVGAYLAAQHLLDAQWHPGVQQRDELRQDTTDTVFHIFITHALELVLEWHCSPNTAPAGNILATDGRTDNQTAQHEQGRVASTWYCFIYSSVYAHRSILYGWRDYGETGSMPHGCWGSRQASRQHSCSLPSAI